MPLSNRPKAMPVILLTDDEEREVWMRAVG
jgi:hypothetical protein